MSVGEYLEKGLYSIYIKNGLEEKQKIMHDMSVPRPSDLVPISKPEKTEDPSDVVAESTTAVERPSNLPPISKREKTEGPSDVFDKATKAVKEYAESGNLLILAYLENLLMHVYLEQNLAEKAKIFEEALGWSTT